MMRRIHHPSSHTSEGPLRRARILALVAGVIWFFAMTPASPVAVGQKTEVQDLAIHGGLKEGKGRLVIEAVLDPGALREKSPLYANHLQHTIHVSADRFQHALAVQFEILEGRPTELLLAVNGEGDIRSVDGKGISDWSLRHDSGGRRWLVLRPLEMSELPSSLSVTILATQSIREGAGFVPALTVTPLRPALSDGYLIVESEPSLHLETTNAAGLILIRQEDLPATFQVPSRPGGAKISAYSFHGGSYGLSMQPTPADPEFGSVVLTDFEIQGTMAEHAATFVLTATARVKHPRGASIALLKGDVALLDLPPRHSGDVRFEKDSYTVHFAKPGEYPLRLRFVAGVQEKDGWKVLDFQVAPSALPRFRLSGIPDTAQVRFQGAARPRREGMEWVSTLPPDGMASLSWKVVRPEEERKLFYGVDLFSQISIGTGLMIQRSWLEYKVMQGELFQAAFTVVGDGEITQVEGDQVLSWTATPPSNSISRRLVVRFNQPQRDTFRLQVHMQRALGAFPQTVAAVQLRPDGVTRFAGYGQIVNQGAVRIEVLKATAASQIAPEQLPEAARTLFRSGAGQQFAYRFAGVEFGLQIHAEEIVPELSVSTVLAYHLGEAERAIDAEMELDVREAPVHEVLLRIPRGYAIARLVAPEMSDFFLREPPGQAGTELRVVYAKPMIGRQIIQARLESSPATGATQWVVPPVEVLHAKSIRGYVGLSADPGLRLTPEQATGLSEMASALFPRRIEGLQAAFRVLEPAWHLSVRMERLPQTVQADALHLFSLGESIAYNSSILRYQISGSPLSAFRVRLPEDSKNVEFTGKNLRQWRQTTNGYLIQLHTPATGPYTLLATYERPIRPQGETVDFQGAQALDAQPEQGTVVVLSRNPVEMRPIEASQNLLRLELGEVPPEDRLLIDEPILAAYRYTARPFRLQLALTPLAQGKSLSQFVERAVLHTQVSRAGQVVTDIGYYIKNASHPQFRVHFPPGTHLWSATVNGAAVVPVTTANETLIPLPQQADPNTVMAIRLQMAASSNAVERLFLTAPEVGAPVLFTEWNVDADTGQVVRYRGGSLTPTPGNWDPSGFAAIARLVQGADRVHVLTLCAAALTLIGLASWVWQSTARLGVYRFSVRHLAGLVLGLLALGLAGTSFVALSDLAGRDRRGDQGQLTFLAPVQLAHAPMTLELSAMPAKGAAVRDLASGWPALIGFLAWASLASRRTTAWTGFIRIFGWVLLAWGALRLPHGLLPFGTVIVAFLVVQVITPGFLKMLRQPKKPEAPLHPTSGPAAGPSPAIIAGIVWLLAAPGARADEPASPPTNVSTEVDIPSTWPRTHCPAPRHVESQLRVETGFVTGNVRILWDAAPGETLAVLEDPAVLTAISYPTNDLRLVFGLGARRSHQLIAERSCSAEVIVQYQLPMDNSTHASGFALLTPAGLIHQVELTIVDRDVDVLCSQAVSIAQGFRAKSTVARLSLSPEPGAWINWKPRQRQATLEALEYFAEFSQLYVPLSGVVDGAHRVSIRPAQGELKELTFVIPKGTAITDVSASLPPEPGMAEGSAPPLAKPFTSLWRFDPEAGKLWIELQPAQSQPFALVIRSQVSTGPLPYQTALELITVEGATRQIGTVALATGNEVQLDRVDREAWATLSLNDFPTATLEMLRPAVPGLALRQAYRYTATGGKIRLSASAVQSDVRLETRETLSLGEDRVLLASQVTAVISRTGIFRLSFELPRGLDVESISGEGLSHWTELRVDNARVITLHLLGKSEGSHQFSITLSGPGLRGGRRWEVPQFHLREATRQRGTLTIVPEQGLRLQPAVQQGVTQLDPEKSGLKQRGVLAFQILQAAWHLEVDIEQVDPWIQVNSLQHAAIVEPLVRTTVNLQYQIENGGLKTFRIWLPIEAEGVRFRGEHLADFGPLAGTLTNGLQAWEIKLRRRVLGSYLLQGRYQTALPEGSARITLRGVRAGDATSQRAFLTIEAAGRLQVRPDPLPPALQATEWQNIPRLLQRDLQSVAAHLAYRSLEPSFDFGLVLDHYPAAKLLSGRIKAATFHSAISDNGASLTQVRLEMLPSDKGMLALTLPSGAQFWFAEVGQSGVTPWGLQNQILIPLNTSPHPDETVVVEFFYSSPPSLSSPSTLNVELRAPKFDLPLENVAWKVQLNEKWSVRRPRGSLELADHHLFTKAARGIDAYLAQEAALRRAKTQEAEQLLSLGNLARSQGQSERARAAFQTAYRLSHGSEAFNEDARVQLSNLKIEQTLLALNAGQKIAGDFAGRILDPRGHPSVDPAPRRNLGIDSNSDLDQTAMEALAHRLIAQQEATVYLPATLQMSLPEPEQMLTFRRAVVVEPRDDLHLAFTATDGNRASLWGRAAVLLVVFAILSVLAWLTGRWTSSPQSA